MNEPRATLLRNIRCDGADAETGPYSAGGNQPPARRTRDWNLGHEILYEDKWITVAEFLAAWPKPMALPPPEVPLEPRACDTATACAGRRSPLQFKKVSVVNSPAESTVPQRWTAGAPPPRIRVRANRMVFAFLGVSSRDSPARCNFYARQWLTGLLQLLLSVATLFDGFRHHRLLALGDGGSCVCPERRQTICEMI